MVARPDILWLQPLPDRLWEPAAAREDEPDAIAVNRETIELAFIAALQHLPAPPPRGLRPAGRARLAGPADRRAPGRHRSVGDQRPASGPVDAAGAAARAPGGLGRPRPSRPPRSGPWSAGTWRRSSGADLAAAADLLAEDVRTAMPPWTLWLVGRTAVMAALTASWGPPRSPGHVGWFRMLAIRANGQPAAAAYLRAPGGRRSRPPAFAIGVLRIEVGRVAEIVAFHEPACSRRSAFPRPCRPTRPIRPMRPEHFPDERPSQHGSQPLTRRHHVQAHLHGDHVARRLHRGRGGPVRLGDARRRGARSDISVSGPGLAQHAFQAGLVDEVHLLVFPVVVGGGKPGLPRDIRVDLELLDVVHMHHRTQ